MTQLTRHPLLTVLLAGTLIGACGDSGENSALPLQLTTVRDADATECPDGGAVIASGEDTNLNGLLDVTEVTAVDVVCNGTVGMPGEPGGAGANALVVTTDEPAGANCEQGGVRIDLGLDADLDGALAAEEIDQTIYLCNALDGADGLSFLIETNPASVAECGDAGGLIIDSGLDDDGNGTLEAGEIDNSFPFCAGEAGDNALVEVSVEPPGANCAGGGLQLLTGLDASGDGMLQAGEIGSTSYLCDPVSGLVVTTAVPAGATCPDSGVQIERGLDTNANGTLDAAEVVSTTTVCAGTSGQPALVNTTAEPPGANCSAGGTRVESGVDVDGNGTLDAAEVLNTSFACDGDPGVDGLGNSAVDIVPEPAGANCPNGGTQVSTGPDTNGNGLLDAAEVTDVTYACNAPGANDNLVEVADEPPGPNCASGGRRLDFGVDDNADGILQPAEVDATSYVCSSVPVVPVAIESGGPFAVFVGDSLSDIDISGIGGLSGGYQWSLSTGPSFLGIAPTGTPSTNLTGTADQTGSFTFEVVLTDSTGAVANRTFTLDVNPVPCGPFSGPNANDGVLSTFTVPSPNFTSGVNSIAADNDPNGWVYYMDTATKISRFRKDGSVHEDDIHVGLGIATGDIGLAIDSAGSAIYATNDSTSCTSDCVYRITNDGGATLTYQDMASFTSSTNDDLRGIHVAGTTMYLITHDSIETELYSVDISGALPAPATLVATFPNLEFCTGLDGDSQFLYTMCDDVTGSSDEGFARIALSGFVAEVIIETPSFFSISTTSTVGQQLYGQDTDGNGTYDILFASGDSGSDMFLCDPATPTPGGNFAREWLETSISGEDEGMGYDRANNVIYRVAESSSTVASFQ